MLRNLEDWKTNEYLPERWMCKNKQDGSSDLKLRASDGKRLHSYVAASSYMELSGKYSQELLNRFFFYPDGKNHKQMQSSAKWMTNKYLPEGWKCKPKSENCTILNLLRRDGTRLTCYMSVAEYMELDGGYSKEEKYRA